MAGNFVIGTGVPACLPAIFDAQTATCVDVILPECQRGTAINGARLGWSVASVPGMPLWAWIGSLHGWRWGRRSGSV